MIMRFGEGVVPQRDVCVVGAGPVGIATALALADGGCSVLLIDAGGDEEGASVEAHRFDPDRHVPPHVGSRKGIGGTSRWWGGRLVAFDPVDFAKRPYGFDGDWPFAAADLGAYEAKAASFFGIAAPAPMSPPRWVHPELRFEDVEAWAPQIDAGVLHRSRLSSDERIALVTHAPVCRIELDSAGCSVRALRIGGARPGRIVVDGSVVLAAGGLGTTRLLLDVQRRHASFAGGPGGVLGRYYMGHLFGKIADIVLSRPREVVDHDFVRRGSHFVRRRFTIPSEVQQRERVNNIAFWSENPQFGDPRHGSGFLSLVFLMLAWPALGRRLVSEGKRIAHAGKPPFRVGRHLGNIARSPLTTARDALRIARGKLSRPPAPGFLIRSSVGRYALQYHAEQRPIFESKVTLADIVDADGLPLLDIDLRFSEDDGAAVLRAHAILDKALRDTDVGRLEYHDAPDARLSAIMRQASDGYHQIGTARMGADPSSSVVDADTKVHCCANLYVASSAVFPSSGQANPTFLAVALAMRLAEHLCRARSESTEAGVTISTTETVGTATVQVATVEVSTVEVST